MRRPILALLAGFAALAATALHAAAPADAVHCRDQLAAGKDPPEGRRACVIAIAETYIDAEQQGHRLRPDLLAPDIDRHLVGHPAAFAAGGIARLTRALQDSNIVEIGNRRWSVDGDQAWVLYDARVTGDGTEPSLRRAERISLDHGRIREVVVAVPNGVQ